MIGVHDGLMTTARRILTPGALIAIPVIFAVGSVALAQMPPSPQLPEKPLTVRLATPRPTPVPTTTPTPAPVTVPDPVPVPEPVPEPVPVAPVPPPQGDDDAGDDDGGDDD